MKISIILSNTKLNKNEKIIFFFKVKPKTKYQKY